MGLFDFFKNKKIETKTLASGSYFDTEINDADLKTLINKAISVFQDNPSFDHNQIIDTLKEYRNEEDLALALYRFIPIAYCRLFIPEPNYSDEFVVYKSQNEKRSFSFSSDKIYRSVMNESKERFAKENMQEKILPILFHSADFKAIQDALKGGSELKNLVCSPSYFL